MSSGASVRRRGTADAISLAVLVSSPTYATRAAAVAVQIGQSADSREILALLHEGTAALGAENAVFLSFIRDSAQLSACRFMLVCDPDWCRRYLEAGLIAHDPWLAYAAQHSEPIVASSLAATRSAQQRAIDLAAESGFASAVVVPAHSGPGRSRVSALVLGSSTTGYFEGEGFGPLRVAARMLALELHDWWLARMRRELMLKARITPEDLALLRHQCQGHSSKRIADERCVSKGSIDSHFQRMNAKLGVSNRRMAAQLVLESGLLIG